MGKISSIYESNQILFAVGSRKGKTRKHIAGMIKNKQKKKYTKKKKGGSYMGYTKLGKATLYINKDATEDNRQPHFRGDITLDHAIPKGAKIGLAGWLNEKGNDKSLFFAVSAKDEELQSDKEEDLFPPQ